MNPNNPCDHSAVALAMTLHTKPHLRLHASVGKHSGHLYWWVTYADEVQAYSPTFQRHPTERGAYERARHQLMAGTLRWGN